MAIYAVLRPVGITAALAATTAMAYEVGVDKENATIENEWNSGKTVSDKVVTMSGSASNTIKGAAPYFDILKGESVDRTVTVEATGSDDGTGGAVTMGSAGSAATNTIGNYSTVTAKTDVIMTTETGTNTITGGNSAVTASNSVIMDGPANMVLMGSTVVGNTIEMKNNGKKTITLGEVATDVLGSTVAEFIPDKLKNIKGNFNIVQDSTVGGESTERVSMDATGGSLAANLILGGSTVQALTSTVAEDGTVSGDIDMTGMATVIVNTTLSDVLSDVVTGVVLGDASMVDTLAGVLSTSGTATTIAAANDINLDTKVTLLHGGNLAGGADAALKLTAGNEVNITGAAAVISGNTIINATNINLTGEQKTTITTAELNTLGNLVGAGNLGDTAKGLLDKIGMGDKLDAGMVVSGNAVMGGATLTAGSYAEDGSVAVEGSITTGGTVSAFLNTSTTDVINALLAVKNATEEKPVSELAILSGLLKNSGVATSVTATKDINLGARLNLLHGGNFEGGADAALKLTAGEKVDMTGTFNVVSGNVIVDAETINLTGQQNLSLDLTSLITSTLGNDAATLATKSGILDKIKEKGVNANVVTGGAKLKADNITMDGMMNAVFDTQLSDVVDTVMSGSMDSIKQGGSNQTTLTATNIDLLGRLNVVNGGQVLIDASETVKMEGTFNVVSGGAEVTGKNINMKGQDNLGLNWEGLLAQAGSGGNLVTDSGITDKLSKGINGNLVAGGATLTAGSYAEDGSVAVEGSITTSGMATIMTNATVGDVMGALGQIAGGASELQTLSGLLQNSGVATSVTATKDIELDSRLNLLHGGNFTEDGANALVLDAENAVNMNGTFNVVSGNANVKGNNVSMDADEKVGIDISPVLNGHYAEVAEELGMTDMVKNGLSSNVIAGGAKVSADNDVTMQGYATAIVDTSLGNVINAAMQNDLGQLMKGGSNTTRVEAGNDINLESDLNVVNGGNADKAGGVELYAGNDVNIGGDISVINRATVEAGHNVKITSDKAVLKNATITANVDNKGIVSFENTKAEMMSDVSISGFEVQVTNASIENYGSLTLENAVITNSTLYSGDSANTTVTGSLTLQSATLVYTAESLTLNETAITLGDGGLNPPNDDATAVDAIAGVNFVISVDNLVADAFTREGADFELALFKGGNDDDLALMQKYLTEGEVSFTVYGTGMPATVSGIKVELKEDGDIVVKGNVSVPEPTTATLSLLALAALAGRRRRK